MAAGGQAFAELGYDATTMAAVAERAGSSVGNLYKYFANKHELFDAVVPAELARELGAMTHARIRALGTARDVRELASESPYHVLASELLDYCLARREAVVVLLARAQGTRFASFAADLVADLVSWALTYARAAYPALRTSPELSYALRQAYESFLSGISDALLRFRDETRVRKVISLLTAHHQAGLKRLFEMEGATDADPSHLSKPPLVTPATRARSRHAAAAGAHSVPAGTSARKVDRARGPRRRR